MVRYQTPPIVAVLYNDGSMRLVTILSHLIQDHHEVSTLLGLGSCRVRGNNN